MSADWGSVTPLVLCTEGRGQERRPLTPLSPFPQQLRSSFCYQDCEEAHSGAPGLGASVFLGSRYIVSLFSSSCFNWLCVLSGGSEGKPIFLPFLESGAAFPACPGSRLLRGRDQCSSSLSESPSLCFPPAVLFPPVTSRFSSLICPMMTFAIRSHNAG